MRINQRQKIRSGFSLVELIVSIGLFSVVLFIGLTALLSMSDANKKSQSTRKLVDNITYVLEDMTRSVRLGQNYHCENYAFPGAPPGDINIPKDCTLPDGGNYFAFEGLNGDTNNNNDQIVYRLNTNKIEKSIDGGVSFKPISDPSTAGVIIDHMLFYVTGANNSDSQQSRVLISIQVTVSKGNKDETKINLQTSISQRFNDF